MTKIKSVLLAGFTALAMTSVAQAADKNFNGAYAGAELGYNSFKFTEGLKKDAAYYGIFAGYRIQMDSDLVLGLEGRFGDSSATADFSNNIEISAGRQLGIDATIGYALGKEKDFLAFAFAGYTNARLTNRANNSDTSTTGDGVRFGLGGEYAVTENVSFRVTSAYADYQGDVRDIQVNAGVLFRF